MTMNMHITLKDKQAIIEKFSTLKEKGHSRKENSLNKGTETRKNSLKF